MRLIGSTLAAMSPATVFAEQASGSLEVRSATRLDEDAPGAPTACCLVAKPFSRLTTRKKTLRPDQASRRHFENEGVYP
jgi:hypothetical protein